MTNTSTAVRHFIAVFADPQSAGFVQGMGISEFTAIESAWRAAGHDSDEKAVEFWRRRSGEKIKDIGDVYSAIECTRDLCTYVSQNGTPDRWILNADGLADLERPEAIDEEDIPVRADEIADFVLDGMIKNREYNDAPIASWGEPLSAAIDALDIYKGGTDWYLEIEQDALRDAVVAALADKIAAEIAEERAESEQQ